MLVTPAAVAAPALPAPRALPGTCVPCVVGVKQVMCVEASSFHGFHCVALYLLHMSWVLVHCMFRMLHVSWVSVGCSTVLHVTHVLGLLWVTLWCILRVTCLTWALVHHTLAYSATYVCLGLLWITPWSVIGVKHLRLLWVTSWCVLPDTHVPHSCALHHGVLCIWCVQAGVFLCTRAADPPSSQAPPADLCDSSALVDMGQWGVELSRVAQKCLFLLWGCKCVLVFHGLLLTPTGPGVSLCCMC